MEPVKAFETREEHEEAEAQVLHPELAAQVIEFGPGTAVAIRALPIATERKLMALITSAKKSEATDLERLYEKTAAALMVLVEFYKIPGITEAWIAENIPIDQGIEILNAQTEVGNASRFLRSAVRSLYEPMRQFCEGLQEADLTTVREHGKNLFRHLGEQQAPTPPSVRPGTSA